MGQTFEVIWVAVRAILQVFFVVAVGALMTHMGHFGRETITNLGKISYLVLIPSMAFYKICVGVRLDQLLNAWPFLVYPTLLIVVGWVVGVLLTQYVLRIESKPLRHSITVTLMFGNYGNLPFALLEPVTKDVSPFSEDPVSLQRSLAFASIFLSTASLWLWTFGPWYIKNSRSVPIQTIPSNNTSSSDEQEEQHGKSSDVESNNHRHADSLAATPSVEMVELDADSSSSSDHGAIEAFQPRLPLRQRMAAYISSAVHIVLRSRIWTILTPSTFACILAVMMVAIGPVHDAFFLPVPKPIATAPSTPPTTPYYNETSPGVNNIDTSLDCVPPTPLATRAPSPPLGFVGDTIGSLANLCVPISLLLLGSNLYTTIKTQLARARLSAADSSTTPSISSILPISKRVLFGAVATRLILLPIISFVITWTAWKVGILPSDPLITVILIVEGCTPSAINLVILAQLQDDQLVVEQLSTILLVQYLLCTFPIFTSIALGIKVFT